MAEAAAAAAGQDRAGTLPRERLPTTRPRPTLSPRRRGRALEARPPGRLPSVEHCTFSNTHARTRDHASLPAGTGERWTPAYLADCIKTDHGYTPASPPVRALLEVLSELDAVEQRR